MNILDSSAVNDNSVVELTPEELEDDMSKELLDGARLCELFALRPARYADERAKVRLLITSNLSGWRLKDELIKSLGLVVGDTISADVEVLGQTGINTDADKFDLFADGEAADWLIDQLISTDSPVGTVINCVVKLKYCQAPVGGIEGRMVNKVSLVLEKGINTYGHLSVV